MTFRILIGDDHAGLRSTLKATLEARDGWQVCGFAGNGREAVQKAAGLAPDAVILDFAMPVLDGVHAAAEILHATPDIPILLYTNHPSSMLESEAKKAGVRQVFSKNRSVNELLDAVAALANQKVQPAAPKSESDGKGSDSEIREAQRPNRDHRLGR